MKRLRELCAWLRAGGARFPALSLEIGPHGERLVRATRDIAPGEVALAVPRTQLVTTETVRASPAGRALSAAGIDPAKGQLALAAYLLAEARARRPASGPYLRALPARFPMLPLFYEDAELGLLRGSLALRKLEERRAALAREHASLLRAPMFGDVGFTELARARAAVVSRVFGLRIGGRKTDALVPLADMMNHSATPAVEWGYDDDASEYTMRATRLVRAGEEVHDSYGPKCDSRFFVSYGFALDDNPDNEALVDLAAAEGEPRSCAAAALLRAGGTARSFQITARADDERTQRALAFLRTACASESELPRVATALARGPLVPPLSPRNEAAALTLLARACEQALSRFDTSSAEDDALLRRDGLSRRERLCIVVRRGEKRVLAHHVALAAAAAPLLRLPAEALRRAMSGRGEPRDRLDASLRAVVRPFLARDLPPPLSRPAALPA